MAFSHDLGPSILCPTKEVSNPYLSPPPSVQGPLHLHSGLGLECLQLYLGLGLESLQLHLGLGLESLQLHSGLGLEAPQTTSLVSCASAFCDEINQTQEKLKDN
jgi:hypothetical protein